MIAYLLRLLAVFSLISTPLPPSIHTASCVSGSLPSTILISVFSVRVQFSKSFFLILCPRNFICHFLILSDLSHAIFFQSSLLIGRSMHVIFYILLQNCISLVPSLFHIRGMIVQNSLPYKMIFIYKKKNPTNFVDIIYSTCNYSWSKEYISLFHFVFLNSKTFLKGILFTNREIYFFRKVTFYGKIYMQYIMCC